MKHTLERITDTVIDEICTIGGFASTSAKLDSKLVDDLGLDSLDGVEIAMGIEDELSIEIPDEAVENCKTVQDVIDAVFNICGEEA